MNEYSLFLIILCVLLERVQSSKVCLISDFTIGRFTILISKGYDISLIYGWVIAAFFGHIFDSLTLPIMVMFAIGASFGWTEAINAPLNGRKQRIEALDKWQFGLLGKPNQSWLALLARGLLWGIPLVPLAYFDSNLMKMPIVMMLSMLLGVLIAKYLPGDKKDRWENQEKIRGLMTGLIVAGVVV